MNLNKRFLSESLDDYHARLRTQQEDINYALRGQQIRAIVSEKFDEWLIRSFDEFSRWPNKAGNLPFVNRKQERTYNSARARRQRFVEDHPPVNLQHRWWGGSPLSSPSLLRRPLVAENIITPEFRAAYISVFKARAQKQEDGSMGKAKYSIRACFPPTADLSLLKTEAEAAARDKWGDKLPRSLRSPFRTNAELDSPVAGIGDDWIIMTFSANEDRRPGLVDAKVQVIIDEEDVYSGAWYLAQVRAFAYENAGNRGVSFGLQNVQKLRDDEPLGAGRVPANKAFKAVDTPADGTPKTASSIFG